jgi:Mn-dependent DtxR family transcriptional regulator
MLTQAIIREKSPSASVEHYARTIYELIVEKGYARPVDIADKLGLSRGAVSVMLKEIEKKGLVEHIDRGHVKLTEAGNLLARKVTARFNALVCFFTEVLGIQEDKAYGDACLMEHFISHQATDRIIDLVEFFRCGDKGEVEKLRGRFAEFKRGCADVGTCPNCGFLGDCDISVVS